MYLLLISALFAWRELTLGRLRLVIQLEILVGLAIALVGMGTFALGGPANQWMFYNNLLAVLNTLVLLPFVLVPRFCRFLVIPNSRVLALVLSFFALEVLYTNLGTVLNYRPLPLVDSLGIAVLLFALG
jgi:hypothetical protein